MAGPPPSAAGGTWWRIREPAREVGVEARIWWDLLPISSGWIDLIRTNIVLEDVARRERLYLTTDAGDAAPLTTLGIQERVRPGTYRLPVDPAGGPLSPPPPARAALRPRGPCGSLRW